MQEAQVREAIKDEIAKSLAPDGLLLATLEPIKKSVDQANEELASVKARISAFEAIETELDAEFPFRKF